MSNMTALFTYSNGKQRQIKVETLAMLIAPVPGWQLVVSDKETYFIAAANVVELRITKEARAEER